MSDFLFDKHGQNFAWIENGRKVFDVETKRQFATVGENGNLYSLNGEFLNMHLRDLHVADAHGSHSGTSTADAAARLKNLARKS
jgi:hypothetical protein